MLLLDALSSTLQRDDSLFPLNRLPTDVVRGDRPVSYTVTFEFLSLHREATADWGIECMRYEVRGGVQPQDICSCHQSCESAA